MPPTSNRKCHRLRFTSPPPPIHSAVYDACRRWCGDASTTSCGAAIYIAFVAAARLWDGIAVLPRLYIILAAVIIVVHGTRASQECARRQSASLLKHPRRREPRCAGEDRTAKRKRMVATSKQCALYPSPCLNSSRRRFQRPQDALPSSMFGYEALTGSKFEPSRL